MDSERPLAIIGSGFLRDAILEHLGARHPGAVVRLLGAGPPEPVEGLWIEHVPGRPTDTDAVNRLLGGAGAVIHLGTDEPGGRGRAMPHAAIVRGTATVVAAASAQGCRHVVLCSGPEVYGDGPGRVMSEADAPVPWTPLARARIMSERLAEQFADRPGRASTVVRPFGLYGPGQPAASTMGRVLEAALAGQDVLLPCDGAYLRNFTYSADVARGVIAAVSRANTEAVPRACYNLASCETVSVGDAARLAVRLSGSAGSVKPPRRRWQRAVAVQIPSVDLAADELGFRATTLLTEGLSRCLLHRQADQFRELVTA